ncbi:hypothetical protein JTE90_010409 [Oedothorax gibbosus]|uniref:Actin-binding LIM protein 1 n=1 Tax=Oedothorax gibbosus TaxID=931172 RepID=A0AAV6W2A2_9ARAC|nr:hypothetical protein JTE90_010409 [Oedothorax gibbosus]
MGKVLCENCKKKCVGNALKVQSKHFHVDCFKCVVCSSSLASGGFFFKEGKYYCTADYQKMFGTKCGACNKFVEGEVVTALGSTYHQKCFVCGRCQQPFPPGENVTFTGKECLCAKCIQIPVVASKAPESPTNLARICGGCKKELQEKQALIALDKQWHIWCFKCVTCSTVLYGEYMGKDGSPYCERDYQRLFGVKCTYCERFIAGKVLQAGDNHHFHPTCARCSKCGDPFGDGEEMYLQGGAIWHPSCGPGPDSQIEDSDLEDSKKDLSIVGIQYGRSSPGSYIERDPLLSDLSRVYTYSYLAAEPTQGYLKRPIDPKPPKSPQFHRPPDGSDKRRTWCKSPSQRPGMQTLVDSIQSTTPRPRSPHMNNEEPIEYSHYPGGQPPPVNDVPTIERDYFPAPPFPFTDPERRRRWSGSSKGMDVEEEQELPEIPDEVVDLKLKKEEEELTKIATGIGKVFLKTVKEREKLKAWKRSNLDPRNASRTPSANKEPPQRLRYFNPVYASPSRDSDHPRPWEEEEFDGKSFRSSTGRLVGTIPNYNVVSSLRHVPKPGYGLASRSPGPGRDSGLGYVSDITFGGLEKTQSSEFSSGKSDISTLSEQGDRLFVNHSGSAIFRSTPYSEGFRGYRYPTYSPHLRHSLPNVNLHLSTEPPKLYPYHLLITLNYRLPPDVDRCHLERHLSNEEFQALFHLTRIQFYRLPEWKRNELKRRARLF